MNLQEGQTAKDGRHDGNAKGRLRRVCGWCGIFLGYKAGGTGVTHGICEACATKELKGA